jgi:hypothetical protein
MLGTAGGKLTLSQRMVYYTAKTVDSVDGDRDAITDTIRTGYVMCFDPVGHDEGVGLADMRGVSVTQCQDDSDGDNSNLFAGIVTRLTKPSTPTVAQWIEIAEPRINPGIPMQAWTLADMSAFLVTPVFLAVVPSEWYLDDTTTANTPNTIREFVALAAGVEDTSSAAGLGTIVLI